ncbi:hypothetical protein GOV12_02040 [Candidatus Pacearchaeota archaeon]|nr:hypothetical protein [Candidatus Pacearchaeota archaeon]
MSWKNYDSWFKGAINGLIVALLISIGIGGKIPILWILASPGPLTCNLLTQCIGNICQACLVVGFMINLFYGFIIGAIIGWALGKVRKKERKNKDRKTKKRKKK